MADTKVEVITATEGKKIEAPLSPPVLDSTPSPTPVVSQGQSSASKHMFRVRQVKKKSMTSIYMVVGHTDRRRLEQKTKFTLAKRYVPPPGDGCPLPGSLEEDLTATPETFFDPRADRSLAQGRTGELGPEKDWAKLSSYACLEGVEADEGERHIQLPTYDHGESPCVDRHKNKRSLRSQDASSKEGGTKGAGRRNCRRVDATDADIAQKYAEAELRLPELGTQTMRYGKTTTSMIQFRESNQERFLDQFERTQQQWERTLQSACNQLGRRPEDSVVARADGFREKVEKVTALEMATPSDVKYGVQNWYMSLRATGVSKDTRHHMLHVGNNYTGLWMHVTDNPNRTHEVVRKPGRLMGSYKTFKDSPYLQDKMRREAKRLSEIIPVRDEQFEGLRVLV